MTIVRAVALLALFFLPFTVSAEQAREFGPYRVHYSAFNADMLDPQVAQSYGITRSGHRAVLTIAVQRPQGDGPSYRYSVPAAVDAVATDLTAKGHPIPMREVREGDVVYYIGEFPIADQQVFDFDIAIHPQGAQEPFTLEFRQAFFTP